MPSKKQIDIESILIQLTLYKEQLNEINELEDKLNQERFLVNEYLNKTFVLLDNILSKYGKKLSN
jgi:pyrimidine operon attenuation protein/uracil phosphoribosyltransferase